MANWNELASKVQVVVADAQSYLIRRSAGPLDATESALLGELSESLNASAARVQLINRSNVVLEEPTWKIWSEQLNLTQQQIRELHEYSDYIAVQSVVGGLNHHLQVMAGPHGPGEGRPDGPAEGNTPGWETGMTG